MAMRRGPGVRPVALATLLATAVLGCSSSNGSRAVTEPTAPGSVPTRTVFDALPQYPGSVPSGPKLRVGRATLRAFSVDGEKSEAVATWYDDHLVSYTVVRAPRRVGDREWQGEWTFGARHLFVSTTPSPAGAASATSGARTQYTLELTDPGVALSQTTTTSSPSAG